MILLGMAGLGMSPAALAAAPAAPNALAATVQPGLEIRLTWTDNSSNETGFEIQRHTNIVGDLTYVPFATVGANVVEYTDSGLTGGLTYYYRIRAVGTLQDGNSAWVEFAQYGIQPLSTPTLSALLVYNGVRLSYSDVSGESSYEIQRSMDAGASWSPLATPGGGSAGGGYWEYTDTTATTPGSTYSYRVRARNSWGTSAWSGTASAYKPNPPPAPTVLSATQIGFAIQLTWTDNSTNETGFEIQRRTYLGSYGPLVTVGPNTVQHTDPGLTGGQTYYYQIRAVGGAQDGNSAWVVFVGNGTYVPPLPSAPGLTATPGTTSFSLSLTGITIGYTYRIERSTDSGINWSLLTSGTFNTSPTSYSDTGLTRGMTYSYRARATNTQGDGPWSITAGGYLPNPPPAAPIGLSATAQTGFAIRLAWTDNATSETGFEIQRKTSFGGTYASLVTVGANVVEYTDSGLAGGTTYYYRIRALGSPADGNSVWVEFAASGTYVPALPPAPGSFAAGAAGTSINLSWSSSYNSYPYEIEWSADGTSWVALTTVTYAGCCTGTYQHTGLTRGQTYWYRIRTSNVSGLGPWSTASAYLPDPPPAPTGPAATIQAGPKIHLTWTDNSTNETGFEIQRTATFGGTYAALSTVGANVVEYPDENVMPASTYFYRIRALGPPADGNSAWVGFATFGYSLPPLPAPPTNLQAFLQQPGNAIWVGWTDNANNETDFLIDRSADGGASWANLATVQASTIIVPQVVPYTDSTVAPNTQYSYRVTARNLSGQSAWSNVETVATSAFVPPDIRVRPAIIRLDEPVVPTQAVASMAAQAETLFAATAVDTDRTVRLERRTIDPDKSQSLTRQPENAGRGRRHLLMQFERLPTPEERKELGLRGIRLLGYVPNQAYWVSVDDPQAALQAGEAGGVRWAVIADPDDKTSGRIHADQFPPTARHHNGSVSLYVRLFEDVPESVARAEIAALRSGITVVATVGQGLLEVQSPRGRIRDIAALDIVSWVEPAPPPPTRQNAVAASRIHVDTIRNGVPALSGSRVTVGVWDGSGAASHPDFDTRLNVKDPISANQDNLEHATHVAGTIGSSGASNSAGTGMAPEVELDSYDFNWHMTEMRAAAAGESAIPLSNHSYGNNGGVVCNDDRSICNWSTATEALFGLYDLQAQEWDDIAQDTGLRIFKSAGNEQQGDCDSLTAPTRCDGPWATITTYGTSKNIVTICATDDADGETPFSSFGPTDDGRVKPDLCANGVQLLSTLPGGLYGELTGTSQATPSATGTAAVLMEHFANEAGDFANGATLKTLLIHGARDLGRVGPDYEFGWGIIDAQATASLISSQSFAEGVIATTGVESIFRVAVTHSGQPLKVTLGWHDVPGSVVAAKALVNDLDLIVEDPDGSPHLPWVLNKTTPTANATTGTNTVDNIEQVVVNNPAVGTWTIRVRGTTVPFGPQPFTVVAPGPLGNSRVLLVYNDGATPLNVTDIYPTTAAPWISLSQTAFTVPGGTVVPVEVDIDFALVPAGTSITQLAVESDDPDENPFPSGVTVTVTRPADTDGDGVLDPYDNCINVANANQCDSDADGFGNRCDADLGPGTGNGATNAQDTTLFRSQLGQPSVAPTYNKADLNCNGVVNAQDTTIFRSLLGSGPGPSGLCPTGFPCAASP